MYRAEVEIPICRIVTDKGAAADYGLIIPATGTVKCLGISGSDQIYPPIEGYTASALADVHASIGHPVTVHLAGSGSQADNEVLLKVTATIANGDPVMADASGGGTGIVATTGKWYVGFARESGVTGNYIRVQVQPGFLGTAT